MSAWAEHDKHIPLIGDLNLRKMNNKKENRVPKSGK